MRIALFISCLTDDYFPRVGIAVVRVLEHLGHEVVFPPSQTCCGQPMYNNGFHDHARALAARMVEIFSGYDAVVTPSGSCAAMVREHVVPLLSGSEAAVDLAERTYEFMEFLTRVERLDLASLTAPCAARVACHDSCHLRGLGLMGQTHRVAQDIGGLEVVPLDNAEQCCGFGGTFAVTYPEISAAMVADKVEAINQAGADLFLCSDAGCAMNIGGALHRAGRAPTIISPAEVIAESLGLMEGTPRE